MNIACRAWWRNCAIEADAEMLAIDRLEDEIAPLTPNLSGVRELISALEVCHHKGERWVSNLVAAIGAGEAHKGLGTRQPGPGHPAEEVWRNACGALAAWCAGCPAGSVDLSVGGVRAPALLACLGERTALKEWQVHRVIEKIRSLIHFPWSSQDPAARYVWLLYAPGEAEPAYLAQCPVAYKEHEAFWLATVRTIILDTESGQRAKLSLGLAIDMLWPCHWNFVGNLQIVLAAIGGDLNSGEAFAACGRNVALSPARARLEVVARALRSFCGQAETGTEPDANVLAQLGTATNAKRWLAASLEKTLRLQLDPPADVRRLSALNGPAWLTGL